jgi:SH3 domain protein
MTRTLALTCLAVLLLGSSDGGAEQLWVKDEVRIAVRTGPGNQYRTLRVIKTGDEATILGRKKDWENVRLADDIEGWIPANYLQPEPPARSILAAREPEMAALRERAERLATENATLQATAEELGASDESQRAEIERLSLENRRMRSGARWPEWIVGASIVGVGMALGALLRGSAGGRRTPRIKI